MEPRSDIHAVLYGVADREGPRLAWSARTRGEHTAWRRRVLRKLRELLGAMPPAPPLEVHWAERRESDAFTRHKIYVRAERDYWVPAFYFVPRALARPTPAVLCFHGHSGVYPYLREGTAKERRVAGELELDYALRLAERGYVTLAPIQRGWNETAQPNPRPEPTNDCYDFAMRSFYVGRTPLGQRAYDGGRLVEFLRSREEVQRGRVAAAGVSAGGAATLYLAALEKRVRAAIVAGFFCPWREGVMGSHHCICSAVPGLRRWAEVSDVAALIAPRPLLLIHGEGDGGFPIAGTRRAAAALRRTYELLEAADDLWTDFFAGGHAWSNRKVLPFLERYLGPPRG